jgi:hypothetical protein
MKINNLILRIVIAIGLALAFIVPQVHAQKIMKPEQACALTSRPDCIPIMTWLYNYCNDPVRVNEDQCVKLYVPESDSGTDVVAQTTNTNSDSAVAETKATPAPTTAPVVKSQVTPVAVTKKEEVKQSTPTPSATPSTVPSATPEVQAKATAAPLVAESNSVRPLLGYAYTITWMSLALLLIAGVCTGLIARIKRAQ